MKWEIKCLNFKVPQAWNSPLEGSNIQRAPDSLEGPPLVRGPWCSEGPLMLTGPLIFIGPLPVGRASDSHRGPVFLAGPDGQRGPDCPDVLFFGFITDFMTYLRVSIASAWVLALAGHRPSGPQNPREAHTLSAAPPPSLGYVPGPEGGDLKLSSRRSWLIP